MIKRWNADNNGKSQKPAKKVAGGEEIRQKINLQFSVSISIPFGGLRHWAWEVTPKNALTKADNQILVM